MSVSQISRPMGAYSRPFKNAFFTVCQLLSVVYHARVEHVGRNDVLKAVEEGDAFSSGRRSCTFQEGFDVYS